MIPSEDNQKLTLWALDQVLASFDPVLAPDIEYIKAIADYLDFGDRTYKLEVRLEPVSRKKDGYVYTGNGNWIKEGKP